MKKTYIVITSMREWVDGEGWKNECVLNREEIELDESELTDDWDFGWEVVPEDSLDRLAEKYANDYSDDIKYIVTYYAEDDEMCETPLAEAEMWESEIVAHERDLDEYRA